MSYLPEWNEGYPDLWVAATELSFIEYNQDVPPEEQFEFIQGLPDAQRYSLVCFLFECEIFNGGFDLVMNCIGLLIPETIKGLQYFEATKHKKLLTSMLGNFTTEYCPRNHDQLIDSWYKYSDENSKNIENMSLLEEQYYQLDNIESLRDKVECNINQNKNRYFLNVT